MSAPLTYDFKWMRGSTTPLKLSFKIDDVAIPYDDIRLSVYAKRTLAFRLTLADNPGVGPGLVEEIEPGVVSFMPTAAQTRMLVQSKNDGSDGKNSYEVEIRNGTSEDIYLIGTITGLGGLNDDEGA